MTELVPHEEFVDSDTVNRVVWVHVEQGERVPHHYLKVQVRKMRRNGKTDFVVQESSAGRHASIFPGSSLRRYRRHQK